jgi:hypothetical protein
MAQRSTGRGALVPLTGVLFVVLTIVSFLIMGDPPDADDPVREVVDFWADHEGQAIFGALLGALGAVALIFFGASLRRTIRRSEDGGGILSVAALGGAIVAAAGIGVDSAFRFALGDLAEDVDPITIHTLNAVWSTFFFPMVIGMATLILATSLAALRARFIPVWLAWIGIVLCVVFFTPLGFISFLVSGLWILVVSILLWRQESSGATTGALT